MKILKGKRNAFLDVFVNDGWENWSRIKIEKGVVHHIKGRRLTQGEIKHVLGNQTSR